MSAPNQGAGARPHTAAPPATGDTERTDYTWSSGGTEDDDPGMFSFIPPVTATTEGTPLSPSTTVPYPPDTAASVVPYSPDMFNRQTNPDLATPIRSPTLSPAAALAQQYALSEQAGAGARRRGSWQQQANGSPDEVVGNPYEVDLNDDPRRISEGSSKVEQQYYGRYDEHGRSDGSSGYGIGMDDQEHAIRLQQLGGPIMPTRSEDEKILAAHGYPMFGADGDFYGEEEDSPYPEVRASVSNIDDIDIPCLTFRSIFLGLFFAIIVTALNVFFYFRYPSPFITPILVQVLAYPCGKFLAYLLPANEWRLPKWSRRFGCPEDFSFNPGPFNIKEHTVLVIIANIATGPAFALNFSVAAEKFYGVDLGAGFDILLILTTQIIGFGIAGLCRRFLVWPAAMIWPQNLVFCTLLNTLHAEDEDIDGGNGGLSRFKFLVWVFSGAFFWYFLPGFLFQALSAFSWVCWIAPNNVVVNQLFGVSTGLGMGLFTFDWSQIAYIGSPLVIPWWAQVNVFFGFFFAFWVIVPAMYYTNVWDSAYLPISSSSVYDRFGETYATSAVVDTARMALNVTAYEEYSPLYLPITYATSYGLAFMLATSIIVHTAIYHGKEIMARVRSVKNSEDDIHMKLMREYPEVPDWWYMVFLVISVGMSIAAVAAWDTQMPVWSLIVSLIIGFLYILPGGFIYAMTNTQISVNLIIELVGGYIIPGLPFANMLFKVYAAQSVGVGLSFVQDLKLGHYMKIPPRTTFTIQICSTFIAAFVQVGVKRWLVATVEDFCDPQQAALLICPSARVFYSSSIIWGLVGPARQFGIGHLYNPILWWLLAGAVAPVISWALTKRYPNTWVEYINVPVALTGAIFMPPATGINFSSWFLFGFVFQFLLRRRYYSVWAKFNFVLSAGLDAGTVCSAVFIFFTLMLPKGGTIFVNWWGNNVYAETLDYNGVAYKPLPEEGFFGRSTW